MNGAGRSSTGPPAELPPPGTIVIYGKPDCCLCDDAKPLVEELAGAYGLDVRLVNITADPQLSAAYRYRIPVVVLDDTVLDEGRVTAATLQHALRRLRTQAPHSGLHAAKAERRPGASGDHPTA